MDSESVEQQLTSALDENARLTKMIESSEAAKQHLKQELNRAIAAAQAATEELHGFVYAASHDVKEALRSVSSYSQLLARRSAGNEEAKEFVHFITEGVKNAVAIIDRLNAFSRIESDPRTTFINLGVVAQMAVLKMQESIRGSGAQIVSHGLPEVSVSESQFTTLFESLLDNAIKYRREDIPHIEITSQEVEDGYEISVADNAAGIASEYQEMVFRPFKRLHTKKIPGIGLGLAICKKIVAAHEGRMWVESDGQTGSTFKILLPF